MRTEPWDTRVTSRVVILVPNWSGGIDRLFEGINEYQGDGFRLSTFNTHGRSLRGLSFLPYSLVYYTSAFAYTLFLPFRLAYFAVLCAAGRIDLCHVNLSTGASTIRKALFAMICRLFGVSYVVHLHGGDYRRFFAGLPRPLQNMARTLYKRANRVIVLGSLWQDYVVREIGVAADRVVVLPNAVPGPDVIDDSLRLSPPRIAFLGRLVEEKGIEEIIEALSDPRVSALEWSAVLAGDGEIARYRGRLEQLGLAERVTLPGWIESEDVAALLREASIFVLPSHFENLPLSMLEAMAHGLCCIVTPVGSVEDVIADGVNGLVIPVGDGKALAEALLAALQSDDLRKRLAEAARRDFLADYNYADYRGKLEDVYASVLKDRS